jgi:hypothetical protein
MVARTINRENRMEDEKVEVAETEVAETTEETVVEAEVDQEKEALKKRLSQAEYVIEKLKKAKPAETQVETNGDEMESRIIGKVRESMASDFLEETLGRIADPIKREAVRQEYETSIVKTGVSRASIEADIAKAAKLVDAELYAKEAHETKEALKAKTAKVNGGGSASKENAAVAEDWKRWLKPAELAYMTERKWSPEMMKRAALDIKANKER